MTPSNIKICVRIRPEQGNERSSKLYREVVKTIGDKIAVFDPPDHTTDGLKSIFTSQKNKDIKYSFDHVFGPEASQSDVYKCTTATVLDNVLDGFNCCVFAYGATGAGKTFTMLGNKEHPGVIYKTVMMLYTKIEALSDQFTFDLDVSYVEIYNEIIKDLLSPGGKLVLNEGSDGMIKLRGVSMHQPKCAEDLLDMLLRGNTERTQSSTAANSESSRSHAIFQIYLRGRPKVSGTTATWRHAKFSLIDLAGSEKGSVSNSNKQKSEGANINRSLLALGNVINALADRKKNSKAFIPYRDSKLTRLLKDSLGGTCQTIMIANCSPSSKCYEDTYNTLKYANRAKNIKVDMVKNVIQVQKHVGEYDALVTELKNEIAVLNKKLNDKNETTEKLKMLEEFNTARKDFDMKCRGVFRERAQYKREITVLEAKEHDLASEIKQKELHVRIITSLDCNSLLIQPLQKDVERLYTAQLTTSKKLRDKKAELEVNLVKANDVQRVIHEYIQHNSHRIPQPHGPEILVELWEHHLANVRSYFSEHSVAALQEANLLAQRHITHMSTLTEELVKIVSSDENIAPGVKEKCHGVCARLLRPDKEEVMWADQLKPEHPVSSLFPPPKLVQHDTLGNCSTPKLNKLQAAHIRGEAFATPAAPRKLLKVCHDKLPINLSLCGDSMVPKRAPRNVPNNKSSNLSGNLSSNTSTEEVATESSTDDSADLNGTFTIDPKPVKKPAKRKTMSGIPGPSSAKKQIRTRTTRSVIPSVRTRSTSKTLSRSFKK